MPNGYPEMPKLSIPAPPQVPVPEGIPAPLQELGHTGQRTLNQAQRSLNGILQGGNPVVEMISGVQSAVQNVPLPVELVAQVRRGMRDIRFPFAELVPPGAPVPPGLGNGGTLENPPGTPTGNRETPENFPVF